MNKLIKISAGLMMVLFLVSSAHSFTKKDPRTVTTTNPAGITYIVDINFIGSNGICDEYYVMLCDENGVPVAPPKMYVEGINSYVFHESGNVNGTRVAQMERNKKTGPTNCGLPVYISPVTMTTNFASGSTYVFNLYPLVIPGVD